MSALVYVPPIALREQPQYRFVRHVPQQNKISSTSEKEQDDRVETYNSSSCEESLLEDVYEKADDFRSGLYFDINAYSNFGNSEEDKKSSSASDEDLLEEMELAEPEVTEGGAFLNTSAVRTGEGSEENKQEKSNFLEVEEAEGRTMTATLLEHTSPELIPSNSMPTKDNHSSVETQKERTGGFLSAEVKNDESSPSLALENPKELDNLDYSGTTKKEDFSIRTPESGKSSPLLSPELKISKKLTPNISPSNCIRSENFSKKTISPQRFTEKEENNYSQKEWESWTKKKDQARLRRWENIKRTKYPVVFEFHGDTVRGRGNSIISGVHSYPNPIGKFLDQLADGYLQKRTAWEDVWSITKIHFFQLKTNALF